MKNKIFTISLITLFVVFNVIMASALPDITGSSAVAENSKWLKNHRSSKKLVRESLHFEVTAEGSSTTGTVDVTGKAEITFVWVDCCKFTTIEYYWCDAALQDKRC